MFFASRKIRAALRGSPSVEFTEDLRLFLALGFYEDRHSQAGSMNFSIYSKTVTFGLSLCVTMR
jgi:hypothetical protein